MLPRLAQFAVPRSIAAGPRRSTPRKNARSRAIVLACSAWVPVTHAAVAPWRGIFQTLARRGARRRCHRRRDAELKHALGIIAAMLVGTASLAGQAPAPLPQSLTQMIETERAFAARALVIGWKQAFLEYFAPDALGFDQGQVGLAREQISKNPDPPPDFQLIWEPRFGDVAGSGDLGYLTGPVRNVRASRDGGKPRHSNYASVWKRQRDGSFKVVMDVGIDTPGPVSFAPGFLRAPQKNRFTGDYDDTTPPLGAADGLLNAELRRDAARAYRPNLAVFARLHRQNVMPIVGDTRILQWLASQPPFTSADTRFTEAARSGDLGYSWGTYTRKAARGADEAGFYVRVWVRERNGQWKLALDVLQPQ